MNCTFKARSSIEFKESFFLIKNLNILSKYIVYQTKCFFSYIYNLPPPPIKKYKYAFVQCLILLDISACHPTKYKKGAGYPRTKFNLDYKLLLFYYVYSKSVLSNPSFNKSRKTLKSSQNFINKSLIITSKKGHLLKKIICVPLKIRPVHLLFFKWYIYFIMKWICHS